MRTGCEVGMKVLILIVIRKADREYKVGDILRLKEWDVGYYTGEEVDVVVRYILHDFEFPDGIKPGYCIMAIDTMV